jgi:cytochrome P450
VVGPGIDFADPGLPRSLHAALGALRSADPVHELSSGRWLVTRYGDVAPLLKDRVRLGTDIHAVRGYDAARPFGAGTALETIQEGLLVNLGVADHRRVRGAFTPPFTRARVEATMTELVTSWTAWMVGALPDFGSVDLLAELAGPLPHRVLAGLFALPDGDIEALRGALHADTVAFDVLLDPAIVSAEALAVGQAGMLELRAYLHELALARVEAPGDDLMSWLLAAHDAGVLTWDDVLTQAGEALAAGTNTTVTLICGMLEALSVQPEAWAALRADRSLLPGAIEEGLRWVSPVLSMGRVALEDFVLDGRAIRAGDVLQLAVLAANRDPAVFADPDRFDIRRVPARPHVAFGGGVHVCLGQHLARLEARAVFDALLDRYAQIEVDADGVALHPTLMVRTYATLPVRLAP